MTPTQGDSVSIFRRPWVRNLLAVFTLMVLLVISVWSYLDAVRVSNLQRMGEYRQLLGADTAANLWTKSIEERDSALFQLRDVRVLNEVSMIYDHLSVDLSRISLTDDQLRELLTLVRQSPRLQVPETVDYQTGVPHLLESRNLIEECCRSGDEASALDAAGLLKSDQERWSIGVELLESLYSGGYSIHEFWRTMLLEVVLERGRGFLGTQELAFIERAESALARIELPGHALARVLQINTMIELESAEDVSSPWLYSLDIQQFLDRAIPISLDPTDPALLVQYLEEPPLYAFKTRLWTDGMDRLIKDIRSSDAKLRALRSAFAATAARIRGVEWLPPEGVELIESTDGLAPRIHITGAAFETDIELPR